MIAKLSDIVILMHPKNPISSNPIKSGKTDRNLNVKLEMVSLIEVVGWKFSFALEKSFQTSVFMLKIFFLINNKKTFDTIFFIQHFSKKLYCCLKKHKNNIKHH